MIPSVAPTDVAEDSEFLEDGDDDGGDGNCDLFGESETYVGGPRAIASNAGPNLYFGKDAKAFVVYQHENYRYRCTDLMIGLGPLNLKEYCETITVVPRPKGSS